MLKLAFLLVCVSCFSDKAAHDAQLRIMNGPRVSHSLYPYMASVNVRKSRSNDTKYTSCGGAIFSATVVATACHCVANTGGERIELRTPVGATVIAGTGNPRKPSEEAQTVGVRSLHCHPQARPDALFGLLQNDAAVVILQKPLRIHGEVGTIKMFSYDKKTLLKKFSQLVSKKEICFVAGWGLPKSNEDHSFSVATLRLMSLSSCRKKYCPEYIFLCHVTRSRTRTCAVPTSQALPCYGDSGGPLVCGGFLYGVYSGAVDCSTNVPKIFSNPSAIMYVLKKYGKIGVVAGHARSKAFVLWAQHDIVLISVTITTGALIG